MADNVQELHDEVVSHVSERVKAKSLSPFAMDAILASIPPIVRTSIDMVVGVGGGAVESLADSHRDMVRAFVSEKTLEYLDGLISGLEDAKAKASL